MEVIRAIDNKFQSIIPIEKRSKKVAYVLVVCGVSLDNMNTACALTSYFSVVEHFNTSYTTATWTLSAYALTLGAFIMLTGKITDIIGGHRVIPVALFMFSMFAMACFLVEEIVSLIVLRAFQGIFASSLIPSSFAIAGNYFQGKEQGKAISLLIFALNCSFCIGLILGGAFSVSAVGYKGIHYFTFAIGMSLTVALYLALVPIVISDAAKKLSVKNLDYYGSALVVIGVLLLTLGFTEGGVSWRRPVVYVSLPLGVISIATAAVFEMWYIQSFKDKVIEKKRDDIEGCETPNKREVSEATHSKEIDDWRFKIQLLFPREVFRIPNFPQLVIAASLSQICFSALLVIQVQYWIYIVGCSPLMASVRTIPACLGLISGASTANEDLLYRIGMKRVLLGTQLVDLCMSIWTSRHNYHNRNSFWIYEAVPMYFYAWAGNYYFFIYSNAVFRRTPKHLQGVVSGLLQTVGQVSVGFANAIIAAILGVLSAVDSESTKQALDKRFDNCFYFIFACLSFSFLLLITIDNQKSVGDEQKVEGQGNNT